MSDGVKSAWAGIVGMQTGRCGGGGNRGRERGKEGERRGEEGERRGGGGPGSVNSDP